jgi:hypothetical protein
MMRTLLVAVMVALAAPATADPPRQQDAVERAAAKSQCQAKTKKGTQCKRAAKPGSKFCWQHQGTTP